MNNAPQTCQNDPGILEILAMEEEKNVKRRQFFERK